MGGGQNRLWLRTLGKSIPSFASATLKITSPETATSVPNWVSPILYVFTFAAMCWIQCL